MLEARYRSWQGCCTGLHSPTHAQCSSHQLAFHLQYNSAQKVLCFVIAYALKCIAE